MYKCTLITLIILAVAMLVLEAPEAVPVGRNATYRCISFGRQETNWAVVTPDGKHYGQADINVSILIYHFHNTHAYT